mmetsp:Transcript_3820/g.6875  ORF Transcript_3820/g.6875 Transcript_3820/m.6875 type:complete len:94 (-) Transcript_3820:155-436(-)
MTLLYGFNETLNHESYLLVILLLGIITYSHILENPSIHFIKTFMSEALYRGMINLSFGQVSTSSSMDSNPFLTLPDLVPSPPFTLTLASLSVA